MIHVKLIATVSQGLAKETILSKLINFVHIFRVNVADKAFDDSQKKYIDTIMKLDNSKTIMLETKGEEIKVQNMKAFFAEQDKYIDVEFSALKEEGSDSLFINYGHLEEIPVGTHIMFENSDVKLSVHTIHDGRINCLVLIGGDVEPNRHIQFIDYKPTLSFLSEKDKKDVIWGLQSGVNLIAASSVKKPEDVSSIRDFLQANGGEDIKIYVRIHKKEAFDCLNEIIDIADGIICTHGSLSQLVNDPSMTSFSLLEIVKRRGKPFVVCFDKQAYEDVSVSLVQILQNYVVAGVDNFMLTENIVEEDLLQDTIIQFYDKVQSITIDENILPRVDDFIKKAHAQECIEDYLVYDAFKASKELPIRAIICYTDTGETVSKLVSLKPTVPIIVFTKHDPVYRYINMLRGVKGYKISQNFNYVSFKRIGKEMIRILFKGNISLDDKILILQANESGVERRAESDMINGIELHKFKNI